MQSTCMVGLCAVAPVEMTARGGPPAAAGGGGPPPRTSLNDEELAKALEVGVVKGAVFKLGHLAPCCGQTFWEGEWGWGEGGGGGGLGWGDDVDFKIVGW